MTVLGLPTSKGFDFMALSVTPLDPLTIRQHGPAFVIEFPGGSFPSFLILRPTLTTNPYPSRTLQSSWTIPVMVTATARSL